MYCLLRPTATGANWRIVPRDYAFPKTVSGSMLCYAPCNHRAVLGGDVEPTDEALVLACRRGDAAAWEALVVRYQRLIYAISLRGGLNADQAADVFQHVFTVLLEQLPTIAQPAQIRGWLATTARRETWRMRRRERSSQPLAENGGKDDEAHEVPDDAPLPDEILLALEEEHSVRTAIAALDERCRMLLTLLFYRADPPSYAEVALALGISEGSVGPTRARCLQKLLMVLKAADF